MSSSWACGWVQRKAQADCPSLTISSTATLKATFLTLSLLARRAFQPSCGQARIGGKRGNRPLGGMTTLTYLNRLEDECVVVFWAFLVAQQFVNSQRRDPAPNLL